MRRLILTATLLTLFGCEYRLPPPVPPAQRQLRLIASSPERYAVTVNFGSPTTYQVPRDGRVLVTVPAYHTCGVYLFGVLKVRSENAPFKEWKISFSREGKIVRKLSLQDVNDLPTDNAGYHLLRITG